MLYHVSEDPSITRFDLRSSPNADYPAVWAVSAERLRNYLFPRDCPRVTFFAGPKTSAADREKFLGSSPSVAAFESAWLYRVRTTRLHCYELPPESFQCVDECAGYYQSRLAVVPSGVKVLDDLLAELASRNVEIRILPSLWNLHDVVIASTLSYSIIRMRNAAARELSEIVLTQRR